MISPNRRPHLAASSTMSWQRSGIALVSASSSGRVTGFAATAANLSSRWVDAGLGTSGSPPLAISGEG